MGDIAGAMIGGLFCEQCGQVIDGEEPGFPRTCDSCLDNNYDEEDE